MARRKKDGGGGAGEGANWMDTYGDMVTLLLAFFVLLFSFSTVDAKKWETLVGALTGTGTGTSVIQVMDMTTVVDEPITLDIDADRSTDPYKPESPNGETEGNVEQDLENFFELVEQLRTFITENNLDADLFQDVETFTVILRIKDNIFFDSGDATIKEEAYPLLDSLSHLFSDNMHLIDEITIEGHTDTDPINTSLFTDNWDLSSKRATNTLRYLQLNEGIDVEKLRPLGLGEFHPVESNETVEGKAANRRVDFVIRTVVGTDGDLLEQQMPPSDSSAGSVGTDAN